MPRNGRLSAGPYSGPSTSRHIRSLKQKAPSFLQHAAGPATPSTRLPALSTEHVNPPQGLVSRAPPKAQCPPVIGDTLAFLQNWEDILARRIRECGSVFFTNIFGKDTLIICDAKVAKGFAEKHDVQDVDTITYPFLAKFFDKSDDDVLPNLHTPGLVGRDFQQFKRKAWVEAYGPKHMPECYPVIREIMEEEFRAAEGTDANMADVVHNCSVRVVWYRFSGRKLRKVESGVITEAMDRYVSGFKFGILPNALNPKFKKHLQGKAILKGIIMRELEVMRREYLQARDGSLQPTHDRSSCMMWQLLDMRDGELTNNECLGAAMSAMFAANDTTSMSLSSLMIQLQKNPHVVRRLSQEMNAAAEKHGSDFMAKRDALQKDLAYTEATLWETLRTTVGSKKTAPNVLLQSTRLTKRDIEFGGYHIKEGTRLLLMVPGMLHTEAQFLDDESGLFCTQFKPERMLEDGRLAKPDALPIFGLGPRSCPGQAMAMTEMRVIMELLAKHGMTVHYDNPDTEWALHGIMSAPVESSASVRFTTPSRWDTPTTRSTTDLLRRL